MTHIAGPYSATWNGLSLGQIDDGFELEYGAIVQDIMSDSFRAREDGVFQGVEMLVRFVLNEPNAEGVQALTWPWNATLGNVTGIGKLMSTLAYSLVLTACSGTTAATHFNTITFGSAVLWTDRVTSKFASEQRKIAVSVAILPVPTGTSNMGCAGGTFYTVS